MKDKPSVFDRQFEGTKLSKHFKEVVEAWWKDFNVYNDMDVPPRALRMLKIRLAKATKEFLKGIDDEYVAKLEERIEGLEEEVDTLSESGAGQLRNDLRWKEALICYLLYLYNGGEPLTVEVDKVEGFEDVEFLYEIDDEDHITIKTREPEELYD